MAEELKAGDDCKLVDGTDGYLAEQEGGLVCVPKEVEKAAEAAAAAEESAKAEAEKSNGTVEPKMGDVCKLEDGSDGLLQDQDGTLVCVVKAAA